ncbi:MAG: hypothetical protein H0T62_02350 [Parachlamydiaceae bacterium]|nr:hypothetical protein [Parachlamydiaceae bacterium]
MKTLYLAVILFAFMFKVALTYACSTAIDIKLYHSEVDCNEFEEVISTLSRYEDEWKADEVGNCTYIKPEALYLANNKIYLKVDQISIPLESIHCDQKGYYLDFLCSDFPLNLGWTCCGCKWNNPSRYKGCQNCYKIHCKYRHEFE